jgi:hypothetical protein
MFHQWTHSNTIEKGGRWVLPTSTVSAPDVSVNPYIQGDRIMKALFAVFFLVMASAGFAVGGEPLSPTVPGDPAVVSETLDKVDDILEENELTGKKAKPYCDHGANTWEITIKHGKITGTFYPWEGGSYPVTGTKRGRMMDMIATGLCGAYCISSYELILNKAGKGVYEGTYEQVTCPGYGCSKTGPATLEKGSCP